MLLFEYGSVKDYKKLLNIHPEFITKAKTVKKYILDLNSSNAFITNGNGDYISGEVFDIPDKYIETLDVIKYPLSRKVITVNNGNLFNVNVYILE